MSKKKAKLSKNIEQQSMPTQEILPPVKKQPFRFQPGNTMGGRTKGSRNKFAEQFFKDFHDDWLEHGVGVLIACREEDPSTYLRVAAAIIPKDFDPSDRESAVEKILEQFKTTEELRTFLAGISALGAQQRSHEKVGALGARGKPN